MKIPIATARAPRTISTQPHHGTPPLDLAAVVDPGATLTLVVLLVVGGAVAVCVVVTVVVVAGCVVVVVEVSVVVWVVVVVLTDVPDVVVSAASVPVVDIQATQAPASSASANLTASLLAALVDAALGWNRNKGNWSVRWASDGRKQASTTSRQVRATHVLWPGTMRHR